MPLASRWSLYGASRRLTPLRRGRWVRAMLGRSFLISVHWAMADGTGPVRRSRQENCIPVDGAVLVRQLPRGRPSVPTVTVGDGRQGPGFDMDRMFPRMSAHACQSTHVPASISRHAYRRRHITEGSESSEGSGSSEGSESREGSDGSDSGESSQDSERSESGERRGCARGPVADRGTRTCSPAPTPPRHGGGIAGCSPRARGSADRRRSAVRAAGSYRAAGVPRGDRVVGLLLYRDRDPVGRSPPGGRRLVRDPNAGRHVPVSHLGVVVRLMVARRW